MTYDAAIILGTGIKQNGQLPDSSLANINTAVSLYKNKAVGKLIFAGKWAWNCKYQPPMTEAQAMKDYALKIGIPESDIFTEEESVTTVSSLCLVKEKILIPQNFTSVILISTNEILKIRNLYNLEMVLGPEYTYDIKISNFVYPPEITAELTAKETQKIAEAQKFFHRLTPGDHKTIPQLAQADLDNMIQKRENELNNKLANPTFDKKL